MTPGRGYLLRRGKSGPHPKPGTSPEPSGVASWQFLGPAPTPSGIRSGPRPARYLSTEGRPDNAYFFFGVTPPRISMRASVTVVFAGVFVPSSRG